MKRRVFLLLLASLLVSTQAHAHLGDSLEAITLRLGKPTIPGGLPDTQIFSGRQFVVAQQYSFNPNGYTIEIRCIDSTCVWISYLILANKEWTNDQLQDLLLKNSEGKTWTETTPPLTDAQRQVDDGIYHKYYRSWTRSDGAACVRLGHQLTFTAKTYLDVVAAAKAQAAAESQKTPNL